MYIDDVKDIVNNGKYFEDLYDTVWKLGENKKIQKKNYNGVKIGLFNTPCAGFGDIIVCKTFYDYLKTWYPGAKVTICTTTPIKYESLGIKGDIYKLYNKQNDDDSECIEYDELILKKKIKFDIMLVIPIINKTFDIKVFQKLIPYANVFNTFSVSEYNGEYPPYTFPIGVGKGNLGLMFSNIKLKKQTFVKKPYALVYIQPSPEWGTHSKTCFISYLEMICKKYSPRYPKFEVVIPDWIHDDINDNSQFYNRIKKIITKYYDNWNILYSDGENVPLVESDNKKKSLTFRADVFPQPRELFVSLMKESVEDILVTGDQSLTDVLSCCKSHKNVWYQIAPWKKGLAYNLSKHLPNKYYSTFKTSCGTLRSIKTNIDWKNFLREYDFRVKGKQRMDSILIGRDIMKTDKKLHDNLLKIIDGSRFLETAKNKIDKLK